MQNSPLLLIADTTAATSTSKLVELELRRRMSFAVCERSVRG